MKQLIPVYVIKFLAILPLPACRLLGGILGSLIWWSKGREAVITLKNLHYCFPDLSEAERKRLAKRSLIESSKTFCETGAAWIWPVEKTLRTIKNVRGQDIYDRAIDSGRGIILLAPHLGNWEVLGHYLQTHNPITNMYLPAENPHMDELIRQSRMRGGMKLAPTNRKGVMTLLKNLKQNEVVGILPDQVPEDGSGVFAPFYDRPAYSMKLISNLAKKTGSEIICGYAKRVSGGFEIVFIESEPGIVNEDLELAAVALNKSVENCVNDAVEQYQWEYKRFKKQPDGRTKFYDSLSE